MSDKFTAVKSYIDQISNPDQQKRLVEALEFVTNLDERLELKLDEMPGFFLGAQGIIWFDVTKKHFDVYPTPVTLDQFDEELLANSYPAANGAILIKWDKPVDWDMIREIVEFNLDK